MYNKMQIFRALEAPEASLLEGDEARFRAYRADAWPTAQAALLKGRAAGYLGKPAPALDYQLFRLYGDTGDREAFQSAYFDRRGRLLTFSLLAWLEPGEAVWLHALEDILWGICAEPFWCIPAHFMADGDAALDFSAYATQLDLFSCETGFALAETLALNGARLAPDVARQVRLQLEKRIFAPFLDGGTFYRFEAMPNNWSGVCGSAIGGAALYELRDKAALSAVLHRCLSCVDVYLSSFGEDGVCVEGVGYWTYGFGFFTCFADLLGKRTGGALDLFADERAAAIAQCQQHYYLAGASTVSFADGGEREGFRMGLSCRLQGLFPSAAMPDSRSADPILKDGCYRFCLALRDFLWYDGRAAFGLPQECTVWLSGAQWLISRSGGLALAAKAGSNGESHNHNDCGSFIVCKGGLQMVCDLGAGLYNADYFGPGRYDVFVNASRSHNVPLLGGEEQRPGPQAAAREVWAVLGKADRLSMELSACYGIPSLVSFHRVIAHRKAEKQIGITDTFVFSAPDTIVEAFISRTPILLGPGKAIFRREGVEMCLSFDESRLRPSLSREDYPDHAGITRTAFLLHLTCRAPAGECVCRIIFE